MKSRSVKARRTRTHRVKSRGVKACTVKPRRVETTPGVESRAVQSAPAKSRRRMHPVFEFVLIVAIVIFAAAVTSWLTIT